MGVDIYLSQVMSIFSQRTVCIKRKVVFESFDGKTTSKFIKLPIIPPQKATVSQDVTVESNDACTSEQSVDDSVNGKQNCVN